MMIQNFDTSVDLLRGLIWRFENAPSLRTIAELKQQWYNENQDQFWRDWYDDVFNPLTLNDFGCAVWGRILDIRLNVENERPITDEIFGFGEFYAKYDRGMYHDGPLVRGSLTTAQKRLIIQLRYFQLTTRATIPEINQFMSLLFGDLGRALAWDNHDMSVTYFFQFVPPQPLRYILDQYDLLPRPHGVKAIWKMLPKKRFGFDHPKYFNYDNGHYKTIHIPYVSVIDDGDGIGETPTFSSSPFVIEPAGAAAHTSTDWQLMNEAGEVIWKSLFDTENKTSITLPVGTVQIERQYSIRVRYYISSGQRSGWSLPVEFKTINWHFFPDDQRYSLFLDFTAGLYGEQPAGEVVGYQG